MEKVILIAINERLFKLGLINEETRNKVHLFQMQKTEGKGGRKHGGNACNP